MPKLRWLVIGIVVALGAVACGVSGGSLPSAGSRALADAAKGSWDCVASSDEESISIGDGTFEVGTGNENAEGSWKVVDRDLELHLGRNLVKILNFDGLGLDVGTITVEFPYSGPKRDAPESGTELHTFAIEVTGTDRARITPADDLTTKRWPSAPFDCTRAD